MATESACVERKTKKEEMNTPKRYHDDDLLSIQEVVFSLVALALKL